MTLETSAIVSAISERVCTGTLAKLSGLSIRDLHRTQLAKPVAKKLETACAAKGIDFLGVKR